MSDPSALVAAAKPAVFWTDRADAPSPAEPLHGSFSSDLCIVGGGFTGLWAALQALEDNPGRSVVVLEADVCGSGASSRNGGFCDPSLTHGFLNGLMHWPAEIHTLERLGRQNFEDLLDSIDRFAIHADVQRVDEVSFATSETQLEWQQEESETLTTHGIEHTLLDQRAAHAVAHSPTYLGGLTSSDIALVDPARLAWGLRRAVQRMGGVIHDHSRVTQIDADEQRIRVGTDHGAIHAQRVIVATNAWAEPLRQMRRYIVPVYDHVLMTEPLSAAQMADIGWSGREGLADAGNQFHYY
ncbi:MAG: NAD(P)/FAD-dependent oxidoreductase, partial [Acidimicrobiales bacterium]